MLVFQHKRGSTAEAEEWVGAEGTFFIDLEKKKLYLHDGATPGGSSVSLTQAEIEDIINGLLALDKIEGLTEALANKADLGEDGKVIAEQLPTFPAKAEAITVISGTNDTDFVTAAGLYALLQDIGFTRDDIGKWTLDQNAVGTEPTPE